MASEIQEFGGNIWLRTFYGFDPEGAGYLGFTHESQREKLMQEMKTGDLILIYGASQTETNPSSRGVALGFLQVEMTRCAYDERMSQEALEWRVQRKFQSRWQHGLIVRRAWRLKAPIRIDQIAPHAYDRKFRFQRSTSAIKLNAEECGYALSHSVIEADVFGEPPVSKKATGQLSKILKPSKGIEPTFGEYSGSHQDGEAFVYLFCSTQPSSFMLGKGGNEALVKVGRSKDIVARLAELNRAWPTTVVFRWRELDRLRCNDVSIAHSRETLLKEKFDRMFNSQGGEFFTGNLKQIERAFEEFKVEVASKTIGAPGWADGVKKS